jgi:hypothetical protein
MCVVGWGILVFRVEAVMFRTGLERTIQEALSRGQHLPMALALLRALAAARPAHEAEIAAPDPAFMDETEVWQPNVRAYVPTLVSTIARLAPEYIARLSAAAAATPATSAAPAASGASGSASAGAAVAAAAATTAAAGAGTTGAGPVDDTTVRSLAQTLTVLQPRLLSLSPERHRDLVGALSALLDQRTDVCACPSLLAQGGTGLKGMAGAAVRTQPELLRQVTEVVRTWSQTGLPGALTLRERGRTFASSPPYPRARWASRLCTPIP